MARARAFYEAMLAIHLEQLEGADTGSTIELWAFPMHKDGAGAAGALAKMDGVPSGGNGTIVCFSCADCGVEAKRAATHGGELMKNKFAIGPYGFIALVIDTEGNVAGLHSMQ